jgi:hypothetical protein
MSQNPEKETLMLAIVMILALSAIFAICCLTASAASSIDWTTTNTNVKLYTDQSVTISGYTITATDFSDTEVMLKITKTDTGKEDGSGFYAADSVITTKDDALRILVQKIDPKYTTEKHGSEVIITGRNPCVALAFFAPTQPLMDIKITPDQTYYNSGNGEITATLGIVNIGKGAADNVKITVDSELKMIEGNEVYEVDALSGKGGSTAKSISWEVPVVDATCTKNINVTVDYDDTLNKHYTATYSYPVQIRREYSVKVTKTMTANCYMDESVYATVVVKNGGGYDLHNVNLVDSIPEGFKVTRGEDQLNTVFDLPIGKYKTIQYTLKPTTVGKYKMPVAAVTYQNIAGSSISVTSDICTVYVDGADVTADRIVTVDQGQAVVTLTMANVGNVGTTVRVFDELSQNVSLVSGSLTNAEYLVPGESTTATYTIAFPENTKVVISGKVKFTDLNKRSSVIELPDYTIGAQTKVEDVEEEESPADIFEKPKIAEKPVQNTTPVQNVVEPQNDIVPTENQTQAVEPNYVLIGAVILVFLIIGYSVVHNK